MQRLNLPDHGVKTMRDDAGERVWDPVRRKWLVLQPEEWVRQHVIAYLVKHSKEQVAPAGATTSHGIEGVPGGNA